MKLQHSVQIQYDHYNDVIMGTIAPQITSLTILYSIVFSDADQRKHQNSASLAFVWGIHRGFSIWWRHHTLHRALHKSSVLSMSSHKGPPSLFVADTGTVQDLSPYGTLQPVYCMIFKPVAECKIYACTETPITPIWGAKIIGHHMSKFCSKQPGSSLYDPGL